MLNIKGTAAKLAISLYSKNFKCGFCKPANISQNIVQCNQVNALISQFLINKFICKTGFGKQIKMFVINCFEILF